MSTLPPFDPVPSDLATWGNGPVLRQARAALQRTRPAAWYPVLPLAPPPLRIEIHHYLHLRQLEALHRTGRSGED